MVTHRSVSRRSVRNRTVLAGAMTSSALLAGALGGASPANAHCLSISGFNLGSGCKSAPLSVALGLGADAKAFAAGPFNVGFNNGATEPETPASSDRLSYQDFVKQLTALDDERVKDVGAIDRVRRRVAAAHGSDFGTGAPLPLADDATRSDVSAELQRVERDHVKRLDAYYEGRAKLIEQYPGYYRLLAKKGPEVDPDAAHTVARRAYGKAVQTYLDAHDTAIGKLGLARSEAVAALRKAEANAAKADLGTDEKAKEDARNDLDAKQRAVGEAQEAADRATEARMSAFRELTSAEEALFDASTGTNVQRQSLTSTVQSPTPTVKETHRDPFEPITHLVNSLNPLGGHFDPIGGVQHLLDSVLNPSTQGGQNDPLAPTKKAVDSLNPAAKKKPASDVDEKSPINDAKDSATSDKTAKTTSAEPGADEVEDTSDQPDDVKDTSAGSDADTDTPAKSDTEKDSDT